LLEAESSLDWENNQDRAYVPSTYAASYKKLQDRVTEAKKKLARLESK
jgi:hypothetical protein